MLNIPMKTRLGSKVMTFQDGFKKIQAIHLCLIDNHKLNYKVAYLMLVLGPLLKFYLQLYPLCCEPNTRLLVIV
jgi:hypothetical protein